jgi:hypothetical protein
MPLVAAWREPVLRVPALTVESDERDSAGGFGLRGKGSAP